MTDVLRDKLRAKIAAKHRHHSWWGKLNFWTNELLFYSALVASCATAILATVGLTTTHLYAICAAVPALSLVLLSSLPFLARSSWHEEYCDNLDALERRLLFENLPIVQP